MEKRDEATAAGGAAGSWGLPDVVVGENEFTEHRKHLHRQTVALGQTIALRVQYTQLLHVV